MSDINHVNPDETIKPLEEDNDPPFSKPDDIKAESTNNDHTEEDIDAHEAYDQGLEDARPDRTN